MFKDDKYPIKAKELNSAFAALYTEVFSFTHFPMLREEKIIAIAEHFYESVLEELDWSPSCLSKRLLEVKIEIQATGTYAHTSEEL